MSVIAATVLSDFDPRAHGFASHATFLVALPGVRRKIREDDVSRPLQVALEPLAVATQVRACE